MLGVLGTMVWDRIMLPGGGPTIEAWGGVGYTLSSTAAGLDPGWAVLPMVKVGADLAEEAGAFMADIPGVNRLALTVVPQPNNRVALRYLNDEDRTERLTGGVPEWTWLELEPLAARCDAILVNFISGHELSLETARRLRAGFQGLIFADLHSLLLATRSDGTRVGRAVPDLTTWLSCFDVVQLNRDEAALASADPTSPEAFARNALEAGPRVVAVTLGAEGVVWASSREADGLGSGRVTVGGVTIDSPRRGDPTGCGDVWGGVFFARLLAGDPADAAARFATRLAGRNVGHRGATGLYDILRSEVPP
jgi:sugar/nucleoside kinase (ribokinase family)